MSNLLNQQIEMLSREKHIEPEIVIAAIEDAMVVAARKQYHTDENMRAKLNPESGQIDVYAVRNVVEEVADPKAEMTLAEAKKVNPAAEVGWSRSSGREPSRSRRNSKPRIAPGRSRFAKWPSRFSAT